jgi:hypothetical protein
MYALLAFVVGITIISATSEVITGFGVDLPEE